VFVSHRWWDPDNGLPDNAEGEKYDIICRAVQDMIDVEGIDRPSIVIWCDYASIDQDDPELQKRGIESLVSYAARSDLVLTPVQDEQEAIEAFTTAKHPADLVNYGERAWCRLETYIFMCLSEMLMRPIHYYGFGKVITPPNLSIFSCCMSQNLAPQWCLKRLTSDTTDVDLIEQYSHAQVNAQDPGSGHGEQTKKTTSNSTNDVIVSNASNRDEVGMTGKSGRWVSSKTFTMNTNETNGGDKSAARGVSYTESQLPSSGKLTVKKDRAVIQEMEQKLSAAYVLFAILSQCTLVRIIAAEETQEEMKQDNVSAEESGRSKKSEPAKESQSRLAFTLRGKQVRARDLIKLSGNLKRMPFLPQLVVLDLSRNLIGPTNHGDLEDFLQFANSMLPQLHTLKLSENPTMGSQGIGELVDYIEDSTSLRNLELRLCDIGGEGMKKLANMKTPSTLEVLDVSFNRIGIKYVLKFIKDNRACQLLYNSNKMTPAEFQQARVSESVSL